MYKFFSLSPEQEARFDGLKTTRELQSHGPLGAGQVVPPHSHAQVALYVVRGAADFIGQGIRRILGADATANAVLVPAGAEHGWLSAREGTQIEHVFGEDIAQGILV